MGRLLSNPYQVAIGSSIVLLGLFMYLLFRPQWQVPILPNYLFFHWPLTTSIGSYFHNVPSFLHVFGFSVLSAGIIANRSKAYMAICAAWACVNIVFEILQSDYFSNLNELSIFSTIKSNKVLLWIQNYSTNAVFDYYDIVAILLGALSGYWVLKQTQQKEVDNEQVN